MSLRRWLNRLRGPSKAESAQSTNDSIRADTYLLIAHRKVGTLESVRARQDAAMRLATHRENDDRAFKALQVALHDPHADVRRNAAMYLSTSTRSDVKHSTLRRMLADSDPSVNEYGARLIAKQGTREALPLVTAAFKHPNETIPLTLSEYDLKLPAHPDTLLALRASLASPNANGRHLAFMRLVQVISELKSTRAFRHNGTVQDAANTFAFLGKRFDFGTLQAAPIAAVWRAHERARKTGRPLNPKMLELLAKQAQTNENRTK